MKESNYTFDQHTAQEGWKKIRSGNWKSVFFFLFYLFISSSICISTNIQRTCNNRRLSSSGAIKRTDAEIVCYKGREAICAWQMAERARCVCVCAFELVELSLRARTQQSAWRGRVGFTNISLRFNKKLFTFQAAAHLAAVDKRNRWSSASLTSSLLNLVLIVGGRKKEIRVDGLDVASSAIVDCR